MEKYLQDGGVFTFIVLIGIVLDVGESASPLTTSTYSASRPPIYPVAPVTRMSLGCVMVG
jgi:hypothetical protein